jgi:hypothetical protein
VLILDDTLCEHVGSLCDYVDRHYNHGNDTYPLAHNPVTSYPYSDTFFSSQPHAAFYGTDRHDDCGAAPR